MKQKKIGTKLYVFDLEPYVITNDTDATVIYVQNYVYDAYKALNPSLNIKRYNYNVMSVNKAEWYDYINQDDTVEPTETENPIVEPTEPESPVVQPTVPESPIIEPTEPEPVYEKFSFVSYSQDHSTVYGYGTVQSMESDVEGYSKVEVIDNSTDQSFVGKIFYVIGTTLANGEFAMLYENINNEMVYAGIDVKIYYEGQIPSEIYLLNT